MDLRSFIEENQEELTLISGAKFGDRQSIDALFERYEPLVRKQWNRNKICAYEYDDWRQESLMTMMRVVSQYHADEMVRFCWFYKLALVNRARDLYRTQAASKRIPEEITSSIGEEGEQYLFERNIYGAPGEVVMIRQRFRDLLSHCSKMEAEVFIMWIHGYGVAEIADKIHCKPSQATSALARARKKARELGD